MYRKLHLFITLAAAAGFSWVAPAQAESVYRCGDSYSQKPCPGGKLVEVEDARSASQRSEAAQASQRDARTGEAMEKARLKEEAKPAHVAMPAPKPAEADDAAVKPVTTGKPKKPDQFTAVEPKTPGELHAKKKKKKAKKKTA
jgi:hypothetical protein